MGHDYLRRYFTGDFSAKQKQILAPLIGDWRIVGVELIPSNIERKESEKFRFYLKAEHPLEFISLDVYFLLIQNKICGNIRTNLLLNVDNLIEESVINLKKEIYSNLLGDGIREFSYDTEFNRNRIRVAVSGGKGEFPIFGLNFYGSIDEGSDEGFCMSVIYDD